MQPSIKRIAAYVALTATLGNCASAQLTWDPDANFTNDGGAGTWDLTTTNWDDDGSTPNVLWSNGSAATFGDSGSDDTVDIASGGVTVGDLTHVGTNKLTLKSVVDNDAITIATGTGGATWDTGGGEIEFVNDTVNDTGLSITSGDTLTVQGGGTFDAGLAQADSDWVGAGATLDFTAATTVLGDGFTVGKFGTIKLAGGSTYTHAPAVNRGYANNWDLGAGTVTVTSNTSQFIEFTGIVSGAGKLRVENMGGQVLVLNNVGASFSGGLEIDNARVQAVNDARLGAVPGSIDADNIKIMNGGQLRLGANQTYNANRGITIENGATIEATGTGALTIAGPITGTDGLTFGRNGQPQGKFNLNGVSDYTGGTRIYKALVTLGTDEALGEGLLTIGGNGNNAKLFLNEKTQTVEGLANAGSNGRQVANKNSGAAATGPAGTLIIDVPDGVNRNFAPTYGGQAIANSGNLNTVKNGLGVQRLSNVHVGGSVTVNAGTLELGGGSGVNGVEIGSASVTAAILNFTEDATIASTLSINDGGSLSLSVSETDSSTTAAGATFGPTGSVDLTLDYGLLTGIPSYPALDVTGVDGFDPSSTAITVNIEGNGLEVSQIELIKYNNTAPLADIANFTLGTLPAGVVAVLVNNTANQSIDLNITDAVQSLVWSGDITIDGVADWDITTSNNWNSNLDDYTNFYPTFGTGDSVTFNDSVLDVSASAAEVNLTTTLTPANVTVDNTAAAAYTFSGTGKLSGTMPLTKIGAGTLTISNTTGTNDYTGGTTITTGTIVAGVDNALPANGVVTIGGSGSSILELNGNNLTIGGLETTGDNTRKVQNNGGTNSTLTIDVAGAEDYLYISNFDGTGTIDLVKNGTGTQRFTKDGFNTVPQSITVNNGLFVWDVENPAVATATATGGTLQLGDTFSTTPIGDVTVNSGASLVFNGSANAASVTADAGGSSSFNWTVGNWAGVAGTDWPQIAISGDLTVNSGAASFTVIIDDSTISNFTEANASFTIGTVGGTMSAATSDFTVNQTGFTSGTGTFAVSVSGSNLVLDYTVAASDPFDTWAGGVLFDTDTNGDGVDNGLAWILGATDEDVDALALLPDGAVSSGDLVMTFMIVNPILPHQLFVEYSNNLGSWTSVEVPASSSTVDDLVFVITGSDPLSITVTIPESKASVDGALFGRLSAIEN